ncbi:MAG: Smr/MutS family protein [Henriciella sp.]
MSERKISERDLRYWQAAMKHVRPLSGSRSSTPRDPANFILPAYSKRQEATSATIKATVSTNSKQVRQSPSPARLPADRSKEKMVKRGKQRVSASFDLHGHTQDSAWRVLPDFLRREQARKSDCVIIITGKGRLGEGVLRRNFLLWLESYEATSLVSGYAPAHPRHGGTGAFYVFLRRQPGPN